MQFVRDDSCHGVNIFVCNAVMCCLQVCGLHVISFHVFFHVPLLCCSAVILHANLRLLPILQQMKEGLSLFGLGNIMARHPDICRPLFVPGDEVTVST